MKSKRVNIITIDNRKKFREKMEQANPELSELNMGIDKTIDVKGSEKKVA